MQKPEVVGYDQGCPQSQPPSYLNGCNQIIFCQQATPTMKVVYRNYKGGQSKFIGVGLIIIGVLCIIFSAVSLGMASSGYDDYPFFSWTFPGQGIWGGVLMIITGSLGIAAGASKSKCLIVAFMVLCIVSSNAAGVILALGIMDAVTYAEVIIYSFTEALATVFAMGILLAILGGLGGAFCIWGSVLCCHAVCCCSGPHSDNFMQLNGPQQVVLVATSSPAGQQQFIASPGYPMPVNYQMQMVPNAQMQIVSGARETFAPGYDQPRDHNPGQANTAFTDEIPIKSAY